MASSLEGLECSLCCEYFDNETFCPRVLGCGHSFCTSCLERLLTANSKISCPTCREEVNVPQAGVMGLPKNYELLKIITPQQEEGEGLYICEACEDGKHPATFFCLNCKQDLCKNAARWHTHQKAYRNHQLVPLEPALVTLLCSDHKEKFCLFDQDCGQMVCKRCIKLKHSRHNCLSLAEAASKGSQDLKALATEVSDRTQRIKDAEAQVVKASLDVKKACEEQGALIQSTFKELHAAVTTREKVLMDALDQLQKDKTTILTDQQSRMRKFQESVESTVESVLFTIKSSSNAQLLFSKSVLEWMLQNVDKQSTLLVPETECVPAFSFDPSDVLKALSKTGFIYDKSTCAETTTANGSGLTSTFLGQQAAFTVTARDAHKRDRAQGGDWFVVELQNEFGEKEPKAIANVKDRGNGTYLVTYTVPAGAKSGDYTLTVRLRGAHIKDSPFTVHVGPTIRQMLDDYFASNLGVN